MINVSSNYNRANGVAVCVWQPTIRTADVTVTKSPVMFAFEFSRIGNLFAYFWHSYFLRYGHFFEYMNMHAMNMQRWLGGADLTLHIASREPLEGRC